MINEIHVEMGEVSLIVEHVARPTGKKTGILPGEETRFAMQSGCAKRNKEISWDQMELTSLGQIGSLVSSRASALTKEREIIVPS